MTNVAFAADIKIDCDGKNGTEIGITINSQRAIVNVGKNIAASNVTDCSVIDATQINDMYYLFISAMGEDSTGNPTGYCGAGVDNYDMLIALQPKHESRVISTFLEESCLLEAPMMGDFEHENGVWSSTGTNLQNTKSYHFIYNSHEPEKGFQVTVSPINSQ